MRISKLVENADPSPICKTEVVTNNLNPVWRSITLTSQQFGSKVSDFTDMMKIFQLALLNICIIQCWPGVLPLSCAIFQDDPLLVECFDFQSGGNHELIGYANYY